MYLTFRVSTRRETLFITTKVEYFTLYPFFYHIITILRVSVFVSSSQAHRASQLSYNPVVNTISLKSSSSLLPLLDDSLPPSLIALSLTHLSCLHRWLVILSRNLIIFAQFSYRDLTS